jgi:cupin fold WbuC family metalloprotein
MRKIYSKIDTDVLLHIINRREEISEERVDISPASQFLQVACFKMPKEKTFVPHKHKKQIRTSDICQESWIVVSGKIKAILYDLDDTIIEQVILNPGDISVTYKGGHNYLSLEDGTLVYEYKTGPYISRDADKEAIQ